MYLYAVFHLNLAFSSIEEQQREQVIKECYWPLLKIISQHNIPIGIEATAYTLEVIKSIDTDWVTSFKSLVRQNKCELIASGDSQVIGPLVPATVNDWNLKLGDQYYEDIIGVKPLIAYVNEQALSAGLIDVYIDRGYTAIMMEWDNARAINEGWQQSFLNEPSYARGNSGRTIPVLWNWSIAFQKLQRFSHRQLSASEYHNFVHDSCAKGILAFPVYGSDTEIFNFRPGRFTEEAQTGEYSEWDTIRDCFLTLEKSYQWVLPSKIIAKSITATGKNTVSFTTAESPVVVKKQKKYNLTRWAITGRNDLLLNTLCFKKFDNLMASNEQSPAQWRELCRLWSSDYRTHLTACRYNDIAFLLKDFKQEKTCFSPRTHENSVDIEGDCITHDKTRNIVTISYGTVKLLLNMNRGAAIDSLNFSNIPCIGTLPHGHFNNIELGADFYSNHSLLELLTERKRVTDLSKATWQSTIENDSIVITAEVATDHCTFYKQYIISGNSVKCRIEMSLLERPIASIRVGWITLLNTNGELPYIGTHHGGKVPEYFRLSKNVDHGHPSSPLVSANNCLGATDGKIWFGEQGRGVYISWKPSYCAAIPMLYSKTIDEQHMSRVFFSLSEIDETHQPNGDLLPFEYEISLWEKND